ncbi:MAG: hypothetical protein K1X35_11705 [Caulobacteraceae bacterium]|nr:hypothetical protein [Caulobacteraceae bacterium]
MSHSSFALAAAIALLAAPAFAQTHASPPDQLELTPTLPCDDCADESGLLVTVEPSRDDDSPEVLPLGWREDGQVTANRVRTRASRGASAVRVIRACEISLTLGDEDCASR